MLRGAYFFGLLCFYLYYSTKSGKVDYLCFGFVRIEIEGGMKKLLLLMLCWGVCLASATIVLLSLFFDLSEVMEMERDQKEKVVVAAETDSNHIQIDSLESVPAGSEAKKERRFGICGFCGEGAFRERDSLSVQLADSAAIGGR